MALVRDDSCFADDTVASSLCVKPSPAHRQCCYYSYFIWALHVSLC